MAQALAAGPGGWRLASSRNLSQLLFRQFFRSELPAATLQLSETASRSSPWRRVVDTVWLKRYLQLFPGSEWRLASTRNFSQLLFGQFFRIELLFLHFFRNRFRLFLVTHEFVLFFLLGAFRAALTCSKIGPLGLSLCSQLGLCFIRRERRAEIRNRLEKKLTEMRTSASREERRPRRWTFDGRGCTVWEPRRLGGICLRPTMSPNYSRPGLAVA